MMSSNRSSFRILNVIGDDIRRFWIMPMVIFAALFLSTCTVIILGQDDMGAFLSDINSMGSVYQLLIVAFAPVLSSLVVFHYLHKTDEVIAYHSLPVTRLQHFTGHVVAGALFFTVPVIINSLIMAALSKAVYWYDINGIRQNVFTLSKVFTTMALMLVAMLFVYALSVLAGMLTGTVLMHAIGAMGLNILAPALYWVIKGYLELFLKGYSAEANLPDMSILSPVTGLSGWNYMDRLGLKVAVYLVVALLVFALSYRLYKIRKLETATHNLTYPVMVPIVTYLITFFTATLVAALISGNLFIPVFACLTVVIFILVRMFILKTTRIFNRRTFISLGVYGLALILFMASLAFDITGYEKRMPDLNNVKSVSTNVLNQLEMNDAIDTTNTMTFKDKENIKRVYRIHEKLMKAERDNTYFSLPLFTSDNSYGIIISYDCGGKKMKRIYNVDNAVSLETDKDIKALYESEECKQFLSPFNTLKNDKNIDAVTLQVSCYLTGIILSVSDSGDKKTLLTAMEKDISARSFEESMDMSVTSVLGDIHIVTGNDSIYFALLSTDKNTMDWLDSHGYHDEFNVNDVVIENLTAEENKEGGRTVDFGKRFAGMTVSDFLDTYGKGDIDMEDPKIIVTLTVSSPAQIGKVSFDLYYGDDDMPDFLRDIK